VNKEKRMYTWVKITPKMQADLKSVSENPDKFPLGESIIIDDKEVIVHHVDDASAFNDQTAFPRILHPQWTTLEAVPGIPPLFPYPHFDSLFDPTSRSHFYNLFIATLIFCAFRL
jgi:hypothetical protein